MKIKFENIKNTLRKIGRYGPYIPLSNVIINYCGSFMTERSIRRISNNRNRKIQKHLKPIIRNIETSVNTDNKLLYDAKIWVCWLQGEDKLPPVAKLCISSIRKNANGHEVILLTEKNYGDYVQLPEILINRFERGQLKPAHFADIIRMNILAQHGGLWLDSTVLVTNPIPETIFNADFFSIKTPEIGYYVSRCRWAVFALACKPNNIILSKVSEAFTRYLLSTDLFVDYFLFDHFIDILYQSDSKVRNQIDSVEYNNAKVHELNVLLTNSFDETKFKALTDDTYLFKLSNRSYSDDDLNKTGTFFSYLQAKNA